MTKKFLIIEIDKDYRTVSGTEIKEFASRKEAEAWCRKESWSGYHYFVDKMEFS